MPRASGASSKHYSPQWLLDHPLARMMTVRAWGSALPYPRPTSLNHSSSVSTATPSFLAFSSFEPAPGPATT